MAITAPDGTKWPAAAYTKQQIVDKLTYWRELWVEHKAGAVQTPPVTHDEIWRELDRWLDELHDLKGRT